MKRLFRSDLTELSEHWMQSAHLLFAEHRLTAALHSAGIALECALKAHIARLTLAEEFPDKRFVEAAWRHEPDRLIEAAGLKNALELDVEVHGNWVIVKDWKVDSRYDLSPISDAVRDFLAALDAPTNGVLQWLRNR